MKKIFLLLTASAFLFAFNKDKNKARSFKGSDIQVHGGKAWSSVKLLKDGSPLQLSLILDDATLNSVPASSGGHGHGHGNDFIIPLHDKATKATPFKFIMLNWNPNGHEPDNIYTLPHFDMHFYMTPAEEVMNYTDTVKMDRNLPSAEYFPATYISPVGGVPQMGRHWIDVKSPEFNGQKFTETLIYGSYDNQVIFVEPMITLDFLKKTTTFERPIPQPVKYKVAGSYPTRMRIVKHDGVTEIILDGFVKRQAS